MVQSRAKKAAQSTLGTIKKQLEELSCCYACADVAERQDPIMGSVYRRSLVYCRTCKSRLSTTATQKACRSAGHDVQVRQSKIWTIQYQDASGLNQTESSKTSDKKRPQHTLRLREGAAARRERIVVEDLTVADAAKLVVSDYQVNERKSLTDALGRIKHVWARSSAA